MILKDTILSTVTDRITLLRWLKQVEKALQADTLEDISLTQISDTEVKIRLTFADKQFVESPVLTLPRGPQGVPGKDGKDGQGIAATVGVGTTTTGEAGTPAAVVNVGDETHAVLNFTIPRGDKGEPGEPGVSGTQWYIHEVLMRSTGDITEKLLFIDTISSEITDLNELYLSISGIGPVRYNKIQGGVSTLHSAFFVNSFQIATISVSNFNLFAFNSQGEIFNIPVEFISDTVSPI